MKTWIYGKGWIDTTTQTQIPTKKDEVLNVEFIVDRSVENRHGYIEKYLRFRNYKTKYKAIVRNNQLVGIVGRMYKLIPNEDVITEVRRLSDELHLSCHLLEADWRVYIFLTDDNGNGVVISNSTDGSVALRCDAIIRLSTGAYSVYVSSRVKNIYRKHTKYLDIKDLKEEVSEILTTSARYREMIGKLSEMSIDDYKELIVQLLKENLPSVYTESLPIYSLSINNNRPTLKTLYETIATRIWNRDTDMRTKITLYKKLNDCFVAAGVIATL